MEKINQIKKVRRPPHSKLPCLMSLITKKNKIEEALHNKKKLNPNSLPFPPDNDKPASNTLGIIGNEIRTTNGVNDTPSPIKQITNPQEAEVKHNCTVARTSQPKKLIENNILLWNCNKAAWSLKKRAVL